MKHYNSTDQCSKYRLGDLVAYREEEGVIIGLCVDHDITGDKSSNLRVNIIELITGKTITFLVNSTMCEGTRVLKNIPNFSVENNPELFI